MQGRFKRVWLEQEFFVKFLLGSLAVDHEFSSTILFSFLAISLENSGQTHQLRHFRDRVVVPSFVFGIVVGGVEECHHEHFIVNLPFQPMSDDQHANSLHFEKLLHYLPLEFVHALVDVSDPILNDVQ